MKNVIIPTDFSIKSLKLINAAVNLFEKETLNITLVHALVPDNSISGLLMLTKRLDVSKLLSEDFNSACEVIRNKYGATIHKLKVECYFGTSKQYMRNFLETRKIDAIVLPADYNLKQAVKASTDIVPELAGSGYPLYYESIRTTGVQVTEDASLSELLHI